MNNEEPLMYSQFLLLHPKRRRKNAEPPCTSHGKPGEQIEVDWAGDPAQLIDPDTGEITKAEIFVGVPYLQPVCLCKGIPEPEDR